MKVCLIGDGLVSLTLANVLIQKDLFVDIYSVKKNNLNDQSRTLGISKSNIDYFNKEIINIEKILWNIQKIKIFTDKNIKKELLKFDNKSNVIFSIIQNNQLQKILLDKLKRSKFVKFKENLKVEKNRYKLVINSDPTHPIIKKYFSGTIEKNYNSYAYTTTIVHEKIKNNTAYQNFTKNGPIAFLPISDSKTSIVYSLKSFDKKNNLEMNSLVEKYNPIYSIKKINIWSSFKLRSSSLRNYYRGNILAFGDLLHKIHPLAGQGFNMSLRDIKLLSDLIDEKINLGLDLDEMICHEFQKKTQSRNFIFLSGIDWVYELFNIENKINSDLLKKSINIIGSNKVVNVFLQKFADSGIHY
ncbi:FAD-dependent monooxygenase [Candidatus Pelagibacter sp.]|jgi:2-octaprenyl-6-methoxyphenol hydroxylase|nr:FAD-dependent monooxygenase [Candidatus Pelagibacter sp.]